MELYQIMMIASSIAIIGLLTIQSWVLIKLMPLIKTTAKNSSFFSNKLNPLVASISEKYPLELTQLNINNCQHYSDKTHVHTSDCV